jgi:hypothetical protein
MWSAHVSSPHSDGKPEPGVHGPLAGNTVQPDGYAAEMPWMADVYRSVNAGRRERDGLGMADADGDGAGFWPPLVGGPGGRATATPIAPTAITATAATASLA